MNEGAYIGPLYSVRNSIWRFSARSHWFASLALALIGGLLPVLAVVGMPFYRRRRVFRKRRHYRKRRMFTRRRYMGVKRRTKFTGRSRKWRFVSKPLRSLFNRSLQGNWLSRRGGWAPWMKYLPVALAGGLAAHKTGKYLGPLAYAAADRYMKARLPWFQEMPGGIAYHSMRDTQIPGPPYYTRSVGAALAASQGFPPLMRKRRFGQTRYRDNHGHTRIVGIPEA